jgi:hypothetical protein
MVIAGRHTFEHDSALLGSCRSLRRALQGDERVADRSARRIREDDRERRGSPATAALRVSGGAKCDDDAKRYEKRCDAHPMIYDCGGGSGQAFVHNQLSR